MGHANSKAGGRTLGVPTMQTRTHIGGLAFTGTGHPATGATEHEDGVPTLAPGVTFDGTGEHGVVITPARPGYEQILVDVLGDDAPTVLNGIDTRAPRPLPPDTRDVDVLFNDANTYALWQRGDLLNVVSGRARDLTDAGAAWPAVRAPGAIGLRGCCKAVSEQVVAYLREAGYDAALRGGAFGDSNHYFVTVTRHDGATAIVDATWLQFAGQLGVPADGRPLVLVGRTDAVEHQIEATARGEPTEAGFLKKLLHFYRQRKHREVDK